MAGASRTTHWFSEPDSAIRLSRGHHRNEEVEVAYRSGEVGIEFDFCCPGDFIDLSAMVENILVPRPREIPIGELERA